MIVRLLLAIGLFAVATSPAQESPAGLGKDLFSDPRLSEGGRTSCATCHDPKRSFIDGRADSVGELDIAIGRNSPTLFGIGGVALFRDPAQARFAKGGKEPRVLSLAARCLAPMENELEMGSSPELGVSALRGVPGMKERFDAAFGGQRKEGVTVARVGEALAAFLRELAPPATPYARHLAGDGGALSDQERRGLEVFNGEGRCVACHGGVALSDGLMHVVDPPGGQRIRDRERAAMERRIRLFQRDAGIRGLTEVPRFDPTKLAEEARKKAASLPGGGGYDPSQLEVQTATLWDVARTGPWFRDGSIADLRTAVRTHLAEMAEVAARRKEVAAALRDLDAGGKRAAKRLRPAAPVALPAQALPETDFDALIAFLGALSPR